MRVALCCVCKGENRYLREWVEHYKKLGFDNIIMYDNNDVDGEDINDVIGDYVKEGFVIVNQIKGKKVVQLASYKKCLQTYHCKYDWIAFFDCDEFMEIVKEDNIKDYLSRDVFKDFYVININWKLYGDNGKLHYEDKPLLERFPEECKGEKAKWNIKTKSIVKGDKLTFFENPHKTKLIKQCNAEGGKISGLFKDKVRHDDAFLRHYITKTIEEYVTCKKARKLPTRSDAAADAYLDYEWFVRYSDDTQEKRDIYKQLWNGSK